MRLGEKRPRVLEALILAAWASSGALPAFASEIHDFDVPAEAAPAAIRDFASQARVEILVAGENVEHKRLHAVTGEHSTAEGLTILLADSGLTAQYVAERAIALVGPAGSSDRHAVNGSAQAQTAKEGKRSSSSRFRLAPAADGVAAGKRAVTSYAQDSGRDHPPALKEVIVTAEKRRESLLYVPAPVTVLNTSALADNGQFRLQDYAATVPGLSLAGGAEGGGTQYVTIRGLSTGYFSTPSVAVVVDDVPVGNSSVLNYGSVIVPDIDPGDLKRIEVLRGPQGTLWGADAIGGVIRFVTLDPSTTGFSGHALVQGTDVPAGGAGYALHAGVNVPLSRSFAIRMSAFSRLDPGYIDSVVTGRRNINETRVSGGFFSALWRISDHVSLELNALDQVTHGGGESDIDTNAAFQPALGAYQQTGILGNQSFRSKFQLYSITLHARLGALDFDSVSGFSISGMKDLVDFSAYDAVFGVPVDLGYGVTSDFVTRKLSQEFRLSDSAGTRVDWIAGLFFTHEDTPGLQDNLALVPTTGAQVGAPLFLFNDPARLTEYALYGDLTVHLTRRLALQLGARESENKQAFYNTVNGTATAAFYGYPPPYEAPTDRTKGNAFTYLVTPKFKLTPNAMLYARIASGYRLGGPNIVVGVAALQRVPPSYKPDTTTDYEVGFKGVYFDRRLSLDASAYYIDWKDIQIPVSNAYGIYVQNGGRAKSQGLELSVKARPIDGMVVSAEGSWNQAELTRDLPPNSSEYGLAGDRLPYSSPFSGSLTVDQDLAHIGDATLFAGAAIMYVGARTGEFQSAATPPRFRFPAYTTVNVHTGARYRAWQVNLFLNNVTNSRGILYGEVNTYFGNTSGYDAIITQPRTIGLSVSRNF